MVTKKLTKQQRVARYIRMKGGLTPAELARCLNLTTREINHALGTLKKMGEIQAVGASGKAKYYPAGKTETAFGVHPAQARFTQLLAGVRA